MAGNEGRRSQPSIHPSFGHSNTAHQPAVVRWFDSSPPLLAEVGLESGSGKTKFRNRDAQVARSG
uniref:Uncharacterized protein n=1 Tax=Oryza glumipatula TaxID=40148 RepID=A0A0E0A4Z6_9ORYZ